MRALKVAVVVMGVLIVLGTIGLVVGIARLSGAPRAVAPPAAEAGNAAPFNAVLDEPSGTHITGIAAVRERLAIALQGGGADRVVLVDPMSGAVRGRISLSR